MKSGSATMTIIAAITITLRGEHLLSALECTEQLSSCSYTF